MFKISTINQNYTTNVTVEVPDGSGKSVAHKFKIQFKRVTQAELDEFYRRMNPSKLEDGEKTLTDDELLDQVVTGWEDVLDENDQALDFTPAHFAALKDIFPTRPTLVQSFFESIKSAKRKN